MLSDNTAVDDESGPECGQRVDRLTQKALRNRVEDPSSPPGWRKWNSPAFLLGGSSWSSRFRVEAGVSRSLKGKARGFVKEWEGEMFTHEAFSNLEAIGKLSKLFWWCGPLREVAAVTKGSGTRLVLTRWLFLD